MTALLHLTTDAEWQAARDRGAVVAASLAAVGFIHLSTAEQVHLPANALFSGRDDIVLLWIDPARLAATLRWEPGQPNDPDGMLFPHLYGPIEIESVLWVVPYRPGPDGAFGNPEDALGG
ncbi:MAG: DUF952 domain-containing protein [Geodermatophilaceae bacterium]|nr:DUF952 domain-containing protein [Geodermatophilaceae bacterium]